MILRLRRRQRYRGQRYGQELVVGEICESFRSGMALELDYTFFRTFLAKRKRIP